MLLSNTSILSVLGPVHKDIYVCCEFAEHFAVELGIAFDCFESAVDDCRCRVYIGGSTSIEFATKRRLDVRSFRLFEVRFWRFDGDSASCCRMLLAPFEMLEEP